jgi:hypothetical protein
MLMKVVPPGIPLDPRAVPGKIPGHIGVISAIRVVNAGVKQNAFRADLKLEIIDWVGSSWGDKNFDGFFVIYWVISASIIPPDITILAVKVDIKELGSAAKVHCGLLPGFSTAICQDERREPRKVAPIQLV